MSQGHVLKGSEIPVGSVLCECVREVNGLEWAVPFDRFCISATSGRAV